MPYKEGDADSSKGEETMTTSTTVAIPMPPDIATSNTSHWIELESSETRGRQEEPQAIEPSEDEKRDSKLMSVQDLGSWAKKRTEVGSALKATLNSSPSNLTLTSRVSSDTRCSDCELDSIEFNGSNSNDRRVNEVDQNGELTTELIELEKERAGEYKATASYDIVVLQPEQISKKKHQAKSKGNKIVSQTRGAPDSDSHRGLWKHSNETQLGPVAELRSTDEMRKTEDDRSAGYKEIVELRAAKKTTSDSMKLNKSNERKLEEEEDEQEKEYDDDNLEDKELRNLAENIAYNRARDWTVGSEAQDGFGSLVKLSEGGKLLKRERVHEEKASHSGQQQEARKGYHSTSKHIKSKLSTSSWNVDFREPKFEALKWDPTTTTTTTTTPTKEIDINSLDYSEGKLVVYSLFTFLYVPSKA